MNEENLNQEVELTEEEVNKLIKVRIEKLEELQNSGKDPFQIVKFDNKDNSKDIKEKVRDKINRVLELPVEVMGNKEIKSVKIDSENIEKDEIELLEDMILVAVNDAMKQIDKETEKKLGKYTQGMPGLF